MTIDEETRVDLENFDRIFEAWKLKYPNQPFSVFSAMRISAALKKGVKHQALGPNLNYPGAWLDSGKSMFNEIMATRKILPHQRICEYGCGTLRIGAHFVKSQDQNCFFGVDVSQDFTRHGMKLLGPELIREKRPHLGTIAENVGALISFNVDVLVSTDVACHVHPDEKSAYFENIKNIVHKTGSSAIILAVTSTSPVRYQRSGWAWPEQHYIDGFSPLCLKSAIVRNQFTRAGIGLKSIMMHFQRDA